jgi:predicted aldo/keto reductase-like oxidoreductase
MASEKNIQITADDYQKSSDDLLREALKRTYAERFFFATKLYKIQMMLNKAKITHKPDNLKK